jgi:hypothetical protein
MFQLYFDPSSTELILKRVSTPVVSSDFTQINSQTLSQDWILYSGYLKIYDFLDLSTFTFDIQGTSILEID